MADGTVYNYFANKNALLLGLLDWINQSDRRETDFQQLQEGNTEAFVREYTRQRFAFLGDEGLKLFQAILPEILANAELRSLYREKIIAPTFADIFYNNSLKNGLLPVALPEDIVSSIWALLEEAPDSQIMVDLPSQTVGLPDGSSHGFSIDPFRKLCLLDGVDDLGYLLNKTDVISTYETASKPY